MDIDVLINILTQAKVDELKNVKIMNKNNDDSVFYSENISGFSYDFKDDSVVLFPEYI